MSMYLLQLNYLGKCTFMGQSMASPPIFQKYLTVSFLRAEIGLHLSLCTQQLAWITDRYQVIHSSREDEDNVRLRNWGIISKAECWRCSRVYYVCRQGIVRRWCILSSVSKIRMVTKFVCLRKARKASMSLWCFLLLATYFSGLLFLLPSSLSYLGLFF